MGGFGSGKGFRQRKARSQRRLYIDEVPSINYQWVNLDNVDISRPVGQFSCKNSILYFKMHTHILNGGGIWYSFICPCGRSPRTLYLHNGIFACRQCHNLAYPSENKGKTDRAIYQKWKYSHRLDNDLGLLLKPKCMKIQAYEKISVRIEKYHQLAYNQYFKSNSLNLNY